MGANYRGLEKETRKTGRRFQTGHARRGVGLA